jgi:hypothetical protein
MVGSPPQRPILHVAGAEVTNDELKKPTGFKTAVRKEAMVTNRDDEAARVSQRQQQQPIE